MHCLSEGPLGQRGYAANPAAVGSALGASQPAALVVCARNGEGPQLSKGHHIVEVGCLFPKCSSLSFLKQK
eukprot:1936600-Amphidinium_carterae.1